jgi:TolB protein
MTARLRSSLASRLRQTFRARAWLGKAGKLSVLGGAVILAIQVGCSSDVLGPGEGDVQVPEPPFVSDPVTPVVISPGGIQAAQAATAADEMVSYVSFPPGTFPGADSVHIDNPAAQASVSATVFEGGLDPLPIAAEAGDELVLNVWTDGVPEVILKLVPASSGPTVVRTRPRRGRTAVPIALSVAVVFTEPIDPATITDETVQLLRNGEFVPATLEIREGGFVVELDPDQLLAHETEYTIRVTTGVRDLSGDVFVAPFTSAFSTAATQLTGKIVFESARSGLPEIYVMDAAGGGATRLTYSVAGGASQGPSVSPDGRQIAFSVVVDGPTGPIMNPQIYVMNVDGTEMRILSPDPASSGRPMWSPDGSKIAFQSLRSGDYEIWVMNADGTEPVNLTNDPSWDAFPSWSPDGSRIAFNSSRGGRTGIYVMNADGTQVTQLNAGPQSYYPAWSPDGVRIAFVVAEIFVMNADGTDIVNLTEGRAGSPDMPAWSPDGSRIAFYSAQPSASGIYVMGADGTGITQLPGGRGGFWPSWSP